MKGEVIKLDARRSTGDEPRDITVTGIVTKKYSVPDERYAVALWFEEFGGMPMLAGEPLSTPRQVKLCSTCGTYRIVGVHDCRCSSKV